ncbi:MAG: BsuBI/PstI family type II restriction endonuclease [Elusimicrobia bacterium]|nr:BsuBI/PstI family type II restriction endonuclease [Elusimicrobiota bacterium]
MNKIKQATLILKDLGLPRAQQNDRSALTLLALLDLSPRSEWKDAKTGLIRVHDVLKFVKAKYNKTYAENTRETIRRQTLHQFEQAGIAERNSDDPTRPTNSPNNVYNISPQALATISTYGTPQWEEALRGFIAAQGRLVDKYQKVKTSNTLALPISGDKTITLSPGKHNKLQIKIFEEFKARFCPDASLLYMGDTAHKLLHMEKEELEALGIPITKHDKLPDVVLYDRARNYLFLIEAVTAHGPVSPKRHMELEEILAKCPATRIYVSAFPDFREFKRYANDIAWETEVWVSEVPGHMIHFNGDKFLGPLV